MLQSNFIVVDGGSGGHEHLYVSKFTQALTKLGHRVHICCPNAKAVAEELSESCDHSIAWTEFRDSQWGKTTRGLAQFRKSRIVRWQELFALVDALENRSQAPIKGLVLLSLSHYLSPLISRRWIARKLKHDIVGVHISPTWQVGPTAALQSIRKGILRDDWLLGASVFRSVGILCELAISKLSHDFPLCRFQWFPDVTNIDMPSRPTSLHNEIRRRAVGRFTIILTGSLDHRKNVELFIECARSADPEKYYFVLAGRWTDSAQTSGLASDATLSLAGLEDRLMYWPHKFESEQELNSALAAVDAIWANYKNFYLSSNFVTKAGLLNRPLLSQDYGTIGDRVQRFRLGVLANQDSVDSVLRGLQVLTQNFQTESFGVAEDGTQFRNQFSDIEFEKAVGSLVQIICKTGETINRRHRS